MNRFFSLLLSFLKIGFIGFGGGSALIPIIEEEIVAKKKLLKEEDYNDYVIVSNITPGTLPVKLAAATGKKICGLSGMLGAAIMVSLPGVGITVFLVSILSQLNESVVTLIKDASIGISMFIIMLLINYINKVLKGCKQMKTLGVSWIIMLMAFVLTAGKEINNILGLNHTPIFDISTINLLLLVFFIIFFTEGKLTPFRGSIAGIISILFILCTGKTQIITNETVFTTIKLCMLTLSCYSIFNSMKRNKGKAEKNNELNNNVIAEISSLKVKSNNKEKPSFTGLILEEMSWIIFVILMSVPAAFALNGVGSYLSKGLMSTVISFGGGEAYIAIAETIFISDGSIPSEVFYAQMLPIANALPGPILCKILAAIGYYIAFHATRNVGMGYLLAIVGYAVSIAASCGVFSFILYIYSRFEDLELFQTLKTWILPIISGLLLTTILSMLNENFKIVIEQQGTIIIAIIISTAIFTLLMFLHKRYHLHDLILILISGISSLVVCNFL
jgi:chromate transporter